MPVSYAAIMQEENEARLIARLREGDADAFALVYARHHERVFRYAYHLLGHREDADDVKQETFARAFESCKNFRNQCHITTWLLAICGNLCRDRIKSWERRRVRADGGLQGELAADTRAADPAEIVERADTQAIIRRALFGLPPSQREAIVLHEIEGLTHQEMAEVLGCTVAGAKLRAFRARRVLAARVAILLEME